MSAIPRENALPTPFQTFDLTGDRPETDNRSLLPLRGHPGDRNARPAWALLLIAARIAGDWTVRDVARRAALHVRTLLRIENVEQVPPSRCVLVDLARSLGMDEGETARLLLAGGYVPDDPAMADALLLLYGDGVAPRVRQSVRAELARVAARCGRGNERAVAS